MGVFGHPVSHSMSPCMHKAAYAHLNIKATYEAFEIAPNDLELAVKSIRTEQLTGVNITLPHKVAVIDYLDEISEEAKAIAAVNTVVHRDGRLVGYNTDGQGFLDSLIQESDESIQNKKVLLVGAGGAARSVAVSLARYGVEELAITNRTLGKAAEIAKICEPFQSINVYPRGLAQAGLTGFDIIINTTSIGMHPDMDRMPFSLETLKRGAVVCDLIYTPLKTRWLQEAEKKGAKTINGLGMFVNQGALAFELWTGQSAPRDIMRKAVVEELMKERGD